jgi:hypothetical protein
MFFPASAQPKLCWKLRIYFHFLHFGMLNFTRNSRVFKPKLWIFQLKFRIFTFFILQKTDLPKLQVLVPGGFATETQEVIFLFRNPLEVKTRNLNYYILRYETFGAHWGR